MSNMYSSYQSFIKIRYSILLLLSLIIFSCDATNEMDPLPEVPGRMVFSSQDETGKYQIYTSLTDGSDRKQLTDSKINDFFSPSWSHDGSQIVFTTTLRSEQNQTSIYRMNVEDLIMRPLLISPYNTVVQGRRPKWSPDDSKIAFERCSNCELPNATSYIRIYDLKKKYVDVLSGQGTKNLLMSWVENSRILRLSNLRYNNSENNSSDSDLYTTTINGSVNTRVTTSGKIEDAVWDSRNQSFLIRSKEEPKEWYSIERTTGDTIEVFSSDLKIEFSTFKPIKWSRNGYFLMLQTTENQNEKIIFYNFKENKFIEGIEIKNFKGIDWLYEAE